MKYILATSLVLATCAPAFAETTQDHYKTVVVQNPYTVEVCTNGNGQSDLSNFLTGALIGGAIGNNIPGEKNGGAAGAVIGGILNTERNKSPRCRTETRYTEETQTVYSHSTVTFTHEGRSYTLRFNKQEYMMYEPYEAYMMRRMREEDEKELARQQANDPVKQAFDKLMATIDRIEAKLDRYVEQQCSK